MMKKAMAFCLAALMAAGMTTSAFAAAKDVNPGSVTFDQDSFINGKASVELEYDAVAEPTYTITIPMGVQLVKGGTTSTFKAEGISNLNGGKIVLSITSTRKSRISRCIAATTMCRMRCRASIRTVHPTLSANSIKK